MEDLNPKKVDTGVNPVQPSDPALQEVSPKTPEPTQVGAELHSAPEDNEKQANPSVPTRSDGKPLSKEDIAKIMAIRAGKSKKKSSLIWIVLIILAVIVLFGGVMLFLLSQGTPETNPFLKMLGIEAINRQAILLTLSNIGFGILIFLTFIISVVNLFKSGFAKKDPLKRRKSIIIATISGFFLIVLMVGWAFTYFYLSQGLTAKQPTQITNFITDPAEPINLTAPVVIKFDASEITVDTKKYTILSYTWDFGDGSAGNGKTISHTYEKKGDGEYTVQLKIKGLEKSTNKTVEQEFSKLITIQNEKVMAKIIADQLKGDAPLTVKFDASKSMDPDGEIVAYEWDLDADNQFDDADGQNIEHEFTQVGTYKVFLRVTDNNNESDIAEVEVEVESADKVDGVIEIEGKPEKISTFMNYEFNAGKSSSRFGLITKYSWNFGDGSVVESGRSISHSFKKSGTFDVVLSVEDSEGNKGIETMTIEVAKAAGSPEAKMSTVPVTDSRGVVAGNLPLTVEFDSVGSKDPDGDIVEYSWDFDGDGKVDKTGTKASYTYTEIGTYEAKLALTDSKDNVGADSVVVKVFSSGLQAKLTANPIDGYIPLKVTFDGSGSQYDQGKIVSYKWDFGDDTPELIGDATIEHEYNNIGTFDIKMTAISSDGKRAESTLTVNVRPVPLQACFTSNNLKGPAPLIVTFDPRCSTGAISEYKWDFGYEGRTSRQRKPTHTFSEPGEYEISLEVKDENSVVSTYKSMLTVTGGI